MQLSVPSYATEEIGRHRPQLKHAVVLRMIMHKEVPSYRYLSTGVYNEEAMLRDPQPCPVKEWPSAEARLEIAYPGPHYVVFTADCVDGVPWCPDCARALPAIRAAVCINACDTTMPFANIAMQVTGSRTL